MESRNPVGYEKHKLYSPINTASQRVTTYAEMMANAGSVPMFFVVDNDELTGKGDALYYWSGIDPTLVNPAGTAVNAKKGYVVNTKADLLSLINTPGLDYCDITVLVDESYGGLLSEYFWNKSIITQKLTF